ncbi:MAG: hypothetical protein QOG10_7185 [Kribbellaceae bacterium]|nr:hypothetical protein [Kribbellaceae bacterium]
MTGGTSLGTMRAQLLIVACPSTSSQRAWSHADASVTLRVYAHVIRTHAAGFADTFAAVDEVAPVSEEDDDEDGPEAEALSHYESVA